MSSAVVHPATLFARRLWEEAEEECRNLLVRGRADAPICRIAGLLALRAGHAEEALSHFDRAEALAPGAPAILADRGAALLAAGRREEAVTVLRRALALEPERFDARFTLAEALRGTPEAVEQLRLAAAAASLDLPAPATAVAAQREALHRLADELRRADRPRTAEKAEQLARSSGPETPPPRSSPKAIDIAGLLEQANGLRRSGKREEAERAYRALLAAVPDHKEALHGLSAALRDLGRYAEALPYAARALELAPAEPWRHVQMGNLLAGLKRSAEAVKAYRTALDLDRHLPDVPLCLARLLQGLGRRDEAATMLALAAAQEPEDGTLMQELAEWLLELERPGEAVPWLRRALERGRPVEERLTSALRDCGRSADGLFSGRTRFRLQRVDRTDLRLLDALCRLPLPGDAPVSCAPLTGGFQNTLRKLRTAGGSYALRLEKFPAPRWDFYSEEDHNSRAAHAAGLSPAVRFFDPADGTMLSDFVDGAPMTYESFLDPAPLELAGRLYARLHALPRFLGDYPIIDMMHRKERRAQSKRGEIPDLDSLVGRMEPVLAALQARPAPSAPCHNDPVPQNFIHTGEALRLIDWQCSGQSDPHWELGAFCAQVKLTELLEEVFLSAALGRTDGWAAARVRLYKLVCQRMWLFTHLAAGADGKEGSWPQDARTSAEALRRLLDEPRLALWIGQAAGG